VKANAEGAVTHATPPFPIELKISSLHRLFNSMDPSPFHERDLDHDAEEFIVSWAREAPKHAPIQLVIHLTAPDPDVADPQAMVAASLQHYFEYRAEMLWRDFKQLLKEGRAAFLIGLAFLATCHTISKLLEPGRGPWHGVASEGLIILGWVAMWHPLEILLYRWWPLLATKRLHDKLATAQVEVRVTAGVPNDPRSR
jgi:hypothetical protein